VDQGQIKFTARAVRVRLLLAILLFSGIVNIVDSEEHSNRIILRVGPLEWVADDVRNVPTKKS
jgi:hypothetical protein